MIVLDSGLPSQTCYVQINDTTGDPLTGLAFDSAGLTAYYIRQGESPQAITLDTLGAVNAAYTSGGFIEVDATNMPGVYRLDVPDALTSNTNNVTSVKLVLRGAASMAQMTEEINLSLLKVVKIALDDLNIITTDGFTSVNTSIGNLLSNVAGQVWSFSYDDFNSVAEWLQLIAGAAAAGKISGAEGTSITIRDVADQIDLIHATVDANGNRTAVTIYP